MEVETLKDVLEWTRKFHRNLSGCLRECAGHNESERARLLLDYLAQHENQLAGLVSDFEDQAETRALNTWCYDYMEKHPILHNTHCDVPFQNLGAEEIMNIVTDQHEQVIDLYRYLHARADTEGTRELMDNLKSLEENEAKQMTQAANRLQDM